MRAYIFADPESLISWVQFFFFFFFFFGGGGVINLVNSILQRVDASICFSRGSITLQYTTKKRTIMGAPTKRHLNGVSLAGR